MTEAASTDEPDAGAPSPKRYDLVILGMGSGGMIAAEFAAGLGVTVAVVERARVGGDCLWTGCVPSKALLASARVAHTVRHADAFGLPSTDLRGDVIDTGPVWKRIKAIQADIAASDDDPQRFVDMGVEVLTGTGRVVGPNGVAVRAADGSERVLETRFILVCTGSRPVEPPIEGLAEAGYLTSETIFELDRAPRSLVMIGGGPTAVELAQGLRRLGVPTTVVEAGSSILPRDEPDLVAILHRVLVEEGVEVVVDADVRRVTVDGSHKVVHARVAGDERAPVEQSWVAAEILVAVGRRPNLDGLGLEEVGVVVTDKGVEVDERLRSSVPSIYAVGDVAGRHLFAHSAGYEAVRAVRDMFFPGKGKATDAVPWCTFTDPELAHTGMTIAEAEARHGDDVQVWRQDLIHSDRARTEGATDGAIIVVTHKNRVVGGHILAPAAGEMIHELALATREGVSFSSLGGLVHVYPTLSTGIFQLAGGAAFEKAESFRWLVKKGKRSGSMGP